jgi:hypothetical protein
MGDKQHAARVTWAPRHPPVLTVAGDQPGNTVLSDPHAPRLHSSHPDSHAAHRRPP